ncbi:MAG: hypothetical protein WCV93_01660 [Candidatus Shapirobacteria bacterium]|jgi:hypothetical protein
MTSEVVGQGRLPNLFFLELRERIGVLRKRIPSRADINRWLDVEVGGQMGKVEDLLPKWMLRRHFN